MHNEVLCSLYSICCIFATTICICYLSAPVAPVPELSALPPTALESSVSIDVISSPPLSPVPSCLGASMATSSSMDIPPNIGFPPKRKASGRPKNTATTSVIGLRLHKPSPFSKKTDKKKEDVILQKLIKSEVRGTKRKFEADDLVDIADVTNSVMNEEFDIKLVGKYFTDGARSKARRLVSVTKKLKKYTCSKCKGSLGEEGDPDSLMCDSCLEWIHIRRSCSGELNHPKSARWYCFNCR